MVRILIVLFFLIGVNELFAQKRKAKLELAKDAFGNFSFDSLSLNLSEKGNRELKEFGEWYTKTAKEELHYVYLRGLVTKSELGLDPFMGVKRCKIVIDSLSKLNVNTTLFFITNDEIQKQGTTVGVGFILDTGKTIMVDPINEDEYFNGGKKKHKKKQ